jgi:hypothetical protein
MIIYLELSSGFERRVPAGRRFSRKGARRKGAKTQRRKDAKTQRPKGAKTQGAAAFLSVSLRLLREK